MADLTPAQANRVEQLRAMLDALNPRPTAMTFRCCGGSIKLRPTTNTARFAGVSATCTWSEDNGLIAAWMEAAVRHLEKLGVEYVAVSTQDRKGKKS